ncbi:MAG: hypothetical protein V4547_16360 [Bacteroidota bacterium]
MGNFLAGDVASIVCNHPTLGDLRFEPKANESFNIDRGGIRTNDDANMITSQGKPIYQLNRVRWSVEGPIAVDFEEETDNDVKKLSASPQEGTWTITMLTGVVYKGTGKPVGDIQPDTNTAQMTLKLSGGGELEKIS